jgi:Holliday junction resolvase
MVNLFRLSLIIMPFGKNLNYNKGKRKEYQICNILKKEGYDIVQRTAGSHSPIDIIAINKLTLVIKLIQSKSASFTQGQKEQLQANMHWLNSMFRVEFEVL